MGKVSLYAFIANMFLYCALVIEPPLTLYIRVSRLDSIRCAAIEP